MKRDDHLHQDLGSMPGMNGSPLGSGFHDGGRQPPEGWLWVAPLIIVLGLAAVGGVLLLVA